MTISEIQELREIIAAADFDYDDKEKMVWVTEKGRHYHSKLEGDKFHSIVTSFNYALSLLYAEIETERAAAIISRVIDLQDTNPQSETCGIWSYFLEEPLEEMVSPDWNSADFQGKSLMLCLLDHSNKLTPELTEKIKKSCRLCIESIIRRDMGVQYTNVAVMDCFLTIVFGERYGEPQIAKYGRDKLKRFAAFTNYAGVIEYNSSCYTPLAVRDVALMLKYVKDERSLEYAREINFVLWEMLAKHFRADLLQLTGPQSRAYEDFLSDEKLSEIVLACGGNVSFDRPRRLSVYSLWEKAVCPPELYDYFNGKRLIEYEKGINMMGFNHPWFAYTQTKTMYNSPEYSLGSFNREEFWNQRRPLLSYIKGKKRPYCFRVRVLHDGYDFASAELHCAQHYSAALCHVNFACDRGDNHISNNTLKNATFNARELTVEFQLEGDINDVFYTHEGTDLILNVNKTKIYLNVFFAAFGENKILYEIEKSEDLLLFKVILYRGGPVDICLTDLDRAICGFALSFDEEIKNKVLSAPEDEFLTSTWTVGDSELKISSHKSSRKFIEMMYFDTQEIISR